MCTANAKFRAGGHLDGQAWAAAAAIAAILLSAALGRANQPDPAAFEPEQVVAAVHEAYARAIETHGLGENEEAARLAAAGETDVAVASWWGFDPEDATDALQAAIDTGAPLVAVPKMQSEWNVRPIQLTQSNQTVLFETGAVVMAKQGEFHRRHDRLFNARMRENLTLVGYGATLAMRREEYLSAPYEPSGHRHALGLAGCRDVMVLGLTLRDSGGDGIYIGRGGGNRACENVLIRDVVCDANHRQGISVISAKNLWIDRCVLSNTRGTRPMAGIDLEPNRADEMLVNVRVSNSLFLDNDRGFQAYLAKLTARSAPVSVVWENNYVRGGSWGVLLMRVQAAEGGGPRGTMVFRRNVIEGGSTAGLWIRNIAAGTIEARFEENVLHSVPGTPIVLGTSHDETERQGGVRFRGTLVIDGQDRPAVVVGGQGEWVDATGDLRVINPHGARMEIRARTAEGFALEINPAMQGQAPEGWTRFLAGED